jgi:hypothetical protein
MALSRGEILENPKVIGSTTSSGEVRILDGADTNYVALSVPDSVTTYTIDFPGAIGTNQQALRISAAPVGGVAVLEWYTPTAAAGGSNTQLQYNNAGSIAGISGFTSDGTNLSATGIFTTTANIRTTADLVFQDASSNTFTVTQPTSYTTYSAILPTGIGAVGSALVIDSINSTEATLAWGQPTGTTQNATGAAGAVQYNVSGTFTGETGALDFSYDQTTDTLSIGATSGVGITLDGANGDITASSASIGDIDISPSANTIAASNANGSILLAPNGTGALNIFGGKDIILNGTTSGTTTITSPAAISTYSVEIPTGSPAVNGTPKVMEFSGSAASVARFVSNRKSLTFNIDSGETGTFIPTGERGTVYVPIDCTIVQRIITTGGSAGNASVEVRIINEPTTPQTTDLFTAAADFTLSLASQTYVRATDTTQLTAGDIIQFTVTGTPTVENVSVTFVLEPRV